jgi:two-component system, NarL family, response regulator LiaR
MNMKSKTIRILVVDDHPVVLKGTQALMADIDDVEVVGLASNGMEAIELAASLKPDVILMDIIMPEMDGIEAIRRIIADNPDAKILVLTSFITDERVFPSIKAGAMGYILKDSNLDDLVSAIRQVYHNQPCLHPIVARKVLLDFHNKPKQEPNSEKDLTEREITVLKLLAQGKSNQDIADILVIAEVTVRTHISHILQKLHLENRVQASLYALRQGITDLNGEQNVEK